MEYKDNVIEKLGKLDMQLILLREKITFPDQASVILMDIEKNVERITNLVELEKDE